MKIHYGTIIIKVKAEESEIDEKELELSDDIYELMEKLEKYLEEQLLPFEYELKTI